MPSMNASRTSTPPALHLVRFSHVILPLCIALFHGAILFYVNPRYRLERWVDTTDRLSWVAIIATVFYLSSHLQSTMVTVFSCLPYRLDEWRKQPATHDFERFIICVPSKGENAQTLRRTVSSLLPVLQQDTRISIVLVLEEWNASNFKDCEDDNISICSVPTNYTARKAKNKARALEYYRQTANFGRHDWVLHLDEETVIELHALQACIDFIQRRPNEAFLFAQGMLFYDNRQYFERGFGIFSAADILRCQEELGRFSFQAYYLNSAYFAVHGSFLLINGMLENEITWDCDNLTEDSWFALQASRRGYLFGWLPAIAREQSPSRIIDFLRQRRRWYNGSWRLKGVSSKLMATQWSLGPLGYMLAYLWLFCGCPGRVPLWAFHALEFDFTIQVVGDVAALVLSDVDAGLTWPRILFHILTRPLYFPLVKALEFAAALYALLLPTDSFDVIQKD